MKKLIIASLVLIMVVGCSSNHHLDEVRTVCRNSNLMGYQYTDTEVNIRVLCGIEE